MSTQAVHGSGSSRSHSSKKSSNPKHSSKTKSSSSKSSSRSQTTSNSTSDSGSSTHSAYTQSEPLVYYRNDPTHSNPGYSFAYMNALIYTYGFPDDPEERRELEDEIVAESEARTQGNIDGYEQQTREQRQ